jgi:competence protein ComEC
MKHAFLFTLISLSAGITFARFLSIPFFLYYLFSFTLLFICWLILKKDVWFSVLSTALVFLIGAALWECSRQVPQSHISKLVIYKDDITYAVKGFINAEPEEVNGKMLFAFFVQQVEFNRINRSACGEILVTHNSMLPLKYGESLILKGRFSRPPKSYRDRFCALMHVDMPFALVTLHKNQGGKLKRLSYLIKEKIEQSLWQNLSPLAAGILDAMILGNKKKIPSVVYDSMIKSGTVHILVVSGFNVGVITFTLMLLLKLLRLPLLLRYIITSFCLVIYCYITGSSPPVVRATAMALFFIIGFLIQREPDIHRALILAAIFILVLNPRELFGASFQLSFSSVASIIILYPKLKIIFKLESIRFKPARMLAEGAVVSLSAWAGTFWLIAYYFRIFSPVTLLANIAIVPLATLITLSGFSMVIISFLFPVLAKPFLYSNEVLVFLMLKINHFLINLPFSCIYL